MTDATATTRPQLYGMLYLGEAGERHTNLKRKATAALDIYVRNAVTVARSAAAAGMAFAVVTNAPERLAEALARNGLAEHLRVVAHDFTLDVPADIPFRSAHFKLDLLQAFGTGQFGDFVGLIDIDVFVQAPIAFAETDRLYVYDIYDQATTPAREADIRADLAHFVPGELGPTRWYGGEFIVGGAGAFARLAEEIRALWPDYCAAIGTITYVGDEMVVSAALLRLMRQGVAVHDVSGDDVVARWWSLRTHTPMMSFARAVRSAILHLPADKALLSEVAGAAVAPAAFVARYRKRVAARLPREHAKNIADRLRGRPVQHVPRLS